LTSLLCHGMVTTASHRSLLDVVGEHFTKFYKPGCALSTDEAMIKFDGRLSWKQYMPKSQ